jgi:hypothetical protein
MRREFDALIKNVMWSFYLSINGKNVVRNKYVFKIKRHPDGIIEHCKARLVVKDFDKKKNLISTTLTLSF